MSTENIDILIRASLTDEGELPRTGDVSNSPDVISNGTTMVKNPLKYFHDNYDKDVSQNLKAEQLNYIYVRGKSLAGGLQQGDIYAYYAKDTDLNNPALWTKNALQTRDGKSFVTVSAQSENAIVVTELPFVWTPPNPLGGATYSLIGVIVPEGTQPDFSGVNDFQQYVAGSNNIGWKKVIIDKPTPPPTPGLRWKTTFAYSQGDTERQMNFALKCNNIPSGSMVSFSADNLTGPNPPIKLEKTKVSDGNGSYGIMSEVPANYTGNISFCFYTDAAPPANSSIVFTAFYLDGKGSGPKKQIVVASVTTTN
ncbi:hypothetical protein [Taibaiella koreensis]|uniref:hypothetical protein n=1 Tax=Taibaiella koreensis TaxID=1268548 RepID=UPI000E59EA72|nr:hypothetical protein [Taibaiella koreensis]